MSQLLRSLFAATAKTDERVSLSEIEDRLRGITGGAREAIVASKMNAVAAGVVGGVAFVAGSYLLGRRRGRRRATVLEIRRA